MAYSAYVLDETDRMMMLSIFRPKYPDEIAHHITYAMGKHPNMPDVRYAKVIGRVDDGEGLECLLVSVGGSTKRPDGKPYHITWSIDRSKGYKPVHSNDVIANHKVKPERVPDLMIRISADILQ